MKWIKQELYASCPSRPIHEHGFTGSILTAANWIATIFKHHQGRYIIPPHPTRMLAERDLESLEHPRGYFLALSNSNVSMYHEDGGCVRPTSNNALSCKLESAREFTSLPDWRFEACNSSSRDDSYPDAPAKELTTSRLLARPRGVATSTRAPSSSPRKQPPPPHPATTCHRRAYPTPARRTASSI